MLCEQDKQLELQERSGIHACVLYRGQEQWLQQLLRFTEADKAYRERIAILVPEESLEATQSAIKRFIEPLAHVEFGVVEELFASWAELNIGLCESRLERAVQRCIAEGFEGLRIVVDMSWCADSNVSSKSVEKCIRVIDSLVGAHPLSVFAGFDRQKFSSRRLLHILPFYPSVWVNGVLSENIYHSKLPSVEGEQLQHEALLDYVLSQFDRDAGSLGRSELEGAIRLLKQIIDSMGDGVLVTDRSGALQLINRAAKDILGYDRGDLPFQERVRTIGNYRGDKQTPFPLEELPIARAMRGEEVDQVEIFIKNAQRPDGRWVSTTGRPLRGGQGEVRGGVVVFRDITQKKEGEEMRQRLEARMLQTQKLESLGLLAGGIAHDFNNLLMGIEGHASLAYEEATEANRERINTIRKTSTHLSELCNQLLDFAGRGSFANVPTDIEDLVCDLCGMIQPILSKQARLHLEFSEEPLTVLVDQTQLRQVLMNLVTNASDALPEGEGDITISTQRRQLDASELEGILLHEHLAPGEFVCVSVEDNGAGIEADRLARIFDPFYTTKHSGRGLGLASVLGLVRRHSGGLKVESEPGKGTRFEVLLPYSPQTVERNKGEALSRKASRPGTVLLVDDEEVVRSVAKQILEYAQFDVLVASSGLEALELFAARSACIDVVLLDVSMPDLDGREVYSRLRATDPKARIVLTSGYTEQELLADFSSEGLAGFLQKPYSPEKLIELLEQL